MWRQWPHRRDLPETCRRKIRYPDWASAETAAVDTWRNRPDIGHANPPQPY